MLGFSSQEAFAKALGGFTQDQVSRAERDAGSIPQEILAALAVKHGVSASWILAGVGDWLLVGAGTASIPVIGSTTGGNLAEEKPGDIDELTRRIEALEKGAKTSRVFEVGGVKLRVKVEPVEEG